MTGDSLSGGGSKRGPSIEEQLRSLLENADLVLWAVDAQGEFTLSVGGGLKAIGLEPGQVVGMSAFDVYAQEPTVCEGVRRGLTGDDSRWVVEVAGRTFETQALPVKASDGSISGLMGLSWDVTERLEARRENERLRAQLLQVQKLESLGVLAGGIAHDFNNWLAAIMGSASVALLGLPAENRLRVHMENVISASTRAASLTKQLLAYAGKGSFDVRPIDLSAYVRELVSVLETAVSKKVQIRCELAPNLPAIMADVGQVQQVIMNLVINGAEAIGDVPGTVLVTTGVQDIDDTYARSLFAADALKAGRYVFVEVHDTGCGMDEATQEKVFDPFFSTKFQGRGLGLAAVLGIVRSHHGAIKLYSSPGRGTTFKVLFPATTHATEAPSAPPELVFGEGLVLVVDDDANVREALRALLERFGFSVATAANGREGIQRFKERGDECVLVLLDMTMPELGGEETFRELRQLGSTAPVILMSGYNEVEATRRFVSKGLAGFLQKPFTAQELSARIRRALPQVSSSQT